MELIRLVVKGISFNQMQEGAYALLLEEEERKEQLPIIIGGAEAQSIATALSGDNQRKETFTHDLFVSFSLAFDIYLKKVIIYKLEDGIFFSYLVFKKHSTRQEIEARVSDSIALAIRFEAPIYVAKEVFTKASIAFEENDVYLALKSNMQEDKKNRSQLDIADKDILNKMSREDLKALLNQTIAQEYYEFAAIIKEELDKRKQT